MAKITVYGGSFGRPKGWFHVNGHFWLEGWWGGKPKLIPVDEVEATAPASKDTIERLGGGAELTKAFARVPYADVRRAFVVHFRDRRLLLGVALDQKTSDQITAIAPLPEPQAPEHVPEPPERPDRVSD
jgi:hypothetical protein